MVNPLVERATSNLLVGPDWAKNSEICHILTHDPGQVKDVVKGIRRRIGSKNPKVQILALTLLETLMNNCGDFVHTHVAERGVLQKMMKFAQKKRDYHVREKILMLIDNWQEAFGGPGSRHPQYCAAFHSLLSAGVVFPRRSDRRAPIFTPPGTHSYLPNLHNPDHQQEAAEESDFPTLSLSEIQNARGIVDVLAEMLNGLEPGNKESLRQDALVDLVQQCSTYKQRVVHLINSTPDESLLSQGLALNDDLQRLLAKHEAIASGNSAELETKPLQALIDIDDPVVTIDDHNKQPDEKTLSTNPVNEFCIDLLLPAPAASDGALTPSSKLDAGMDLLSGGDTSSPTAENSLALVPVGEPQESNPASQQNNIALSDMLSQNNFAANSFDPQSTYPSEQAFPSTLQFQYEQNLQDPHSAIYSDGSASNMDLAQYHHQQQQQNERHVNGTQGSSYFPPPPWETQATDNQQPVHPQYLQEMQITQVAGTHSQPMHNSIHSHPVGSNRVVGMYVQPPTGSELAAVHNQSIQSYQLGHQAIEGSSMMGMVTQGGNIYYQSVQSSQLPDYGSHPQYLEQRMYALTMGDDTAAHHPAYQASTPSYVQPSMRPKPEDKLFGDLVNMAKSKPKNSSLDKPGSA